MFDRDLTLNARAFSESCIKMKIIYYLFILFVILIIIYLKINYFHIYLCYLKRFYEFKNVFIFSLCPGSGRQGLKQLWSVICLLVLLLALNIFLCKLNLKQCLKLKIFNAALKLGRRLFKSNNILDMSYFSSENKINMSKYIR